MGNIKIIKRRGRPKKKSAPSGDIAGQMTIFDYIDPETELQTKEKENVTYRRDTFI
ncbi:MAG: hypothetical protein IJ619_10590 [Eubacterium sp.]|nr:hypothetical protein [Eubacterium sp.]